MLLPTTDPSGRSSSTSAEIGSRRAPVGNPRQVLDGSSTSAAARRTQDARRTRRLAVAPVAGPSLALIVAVVLYPAVELVRASLSRYSITGLYQGAVGALNYRRLLEQDALAPVVVNTLTWVTLVVGFTILISLGLAQLLNESFPGPGRALAVIVRGSLAHRDVEAVRVDHDYYLYPEPILYPAGDRRAADWLARRHREGANRRRLLRVLPFRLTSSCRTGDDSRRVSGGALTRLSMARLPALTFRVARLPGHRAEPDLVFNSSRSCGRGRPTRSGHDTWSLMSDRLPDCARDFAWRPLGVLNVAVAGWRARLPKPVRWQTPSVRRTRPVAAALVAAPPSSPRFSSRPISDVPGRCQPAPTAVDAPRLRPSTGCSRHPRGPPRSGLPVGPSRLVVSRSVTWRGGAAPFGRHTRPGTASRRSSFLFLVLSPRCLGRRRWWSVSTGSLHLGLVNTRRRSS